MSSAHVRELGCKRIPRFSSSAVYAGCLLKDRGKELALALSAPDQRSRLRGSSPRASSFRPKSQIQDRSSPRWYSCNQLQDSPSRGLGGGDGFSNDLNSHSETVRLRGIRHDDYDGVLACQSGGRCPRLGFRGENKQPLRTNNPALEEVPGQMSRPRWRSVDGPSGNYALVVEQWTPTLWENGLPFLNHLILVSSLSVAQNRRRKLLGGHADVFRV